MSGPDGDPGRKRRGRPLLWLAVAALVAGVCLAPPPQMLARASAGPPVSPSVTPDWERRVAAAATYAASRSVRVSFAVADQAGRLVGQAASQRPMASAGVLPLLLVGAYLDAVRDAPLSRRERDLVKAVVSGSDHHAANTIVSLVGRRGLRRFVHDAGMSGFRSNRRWDRCRVTAADVAHYLARIDTVTPPRHRTLLLRLLRARTPGLWGIPRVASANWTQHVVGGRRPGVASQAGLLTSGTQQVTLAVLVQAPVGAGRARAGSVEVRTVRGVARRLLGGYEPSPVAYRYWTYWHGSGDSWTYAQTGPGGSVPADGDVEGWRFAVSRGIDGEGAHPRESPATAFAEICADVAAGSDNKRVAVVLDFGDERDAPAGQTPPARRSACVVTVRNASGARILEQVTTPVTDHGLVCAIDGFPVGECAPAITLRSSG